MNRSRPKAKRSRALGIPLTPKCVKYFERREPERREIPVTCDVRPVVEYYSR